MATTEKEDQLDYESDPDETKGSFVMRRRRAASDDEEERVGPRGEKDRDGGGDAGEEKTKQVGGAQPDESDGEGAVAEYDEEEDEEDYYLNGEEEDYVDEEGGYDEEGVVVGVADSRAVPDGLVVHDRVVDKGGSGHVEEAVRKETDAASGAVDAAGEWGDDQGEEEEEEEEEGNLEGKKENEPFAVPTAGAFYMHDDRFRDNVAGRNRL